MKQIQTPQLEITRDGQPTNEFEPTAIEALQAAFKSTTQQFTANARMQARMALYDALHRTQYRRIRNELARKKRNEKFEKSIGLIAVK